MMLATQQRIAVDLVRAMFPSEPDAVGVLAALFGLIAYTPSIKKFRPRHW